MDNVFRVDNICVTCHIHTAQKCVRGKWICLECGTQQPKREEKQEVKGGK